MTRLNGWRHLMSESQPPSSSLRLIGSIVESETQNGVRYRLVRQVGRGGMGMAFLASRDAPEGSSPVVIKVMSPRFGGATVSTDVMAVKEAVALGRLNESVPQTPFVVRYVDSGTELEIGGMRTAWTALEYVHGGVEGTTLQDRVDYAVQRTRFAFDPRRAAHAIRCITAGLAAIHAVGVIHRDLSPGNVLCCGFGQGELFKISDFGIARATGLDRTFDGITLGTLGYTAPESGSSAAGTHSDVFSLASVIYFLLTGTPYLDANEPATSLRLIMSKQRPTLREAPGLSPELAARPADCAVIDEVLALASSPSAGDRPRTATQLASMVLPALSEHGMAPRSSERLLSAVLRSRAPRAAPADFEWTVRSHPGNLRLRSIAWDTDGHALALTSRGASFWNGQSWLDASPIFDRLPGHMVFTQNHEAGGWLVGGRSPVLSVVDAHGVSDRVESPDPNANFCLASGRLDDLLVALHHEHGQSPELCAVIGRRWLKPLPLHGVSFVNALTRLDDERWLLGARTRDGLGFAALYEPLKWQITPLEVPDLRAFISAASTYERSMGILAGTQGVVLRWSDKHTEISRIDNNCDLAAAAMDIQGREWVAGSGVLWSRLTGQDTWHPMWGDSSWNAPFISLMADAGLIIGMTGDGGIVEGRCAVE